MLSEYVRRWSEEELMRRLNWYEGPIHTLSSFISKLQEIQDVYGDLIVLGEYDENVYAMAPERGSIYTYGDLKTYCINPS